MAQTTPDNIIYPDAETSMTPLQTHFGALADSTQQAISGVRAATSPPVSSDAQRLALYPAPVQGNSVFRTDKGYVERYYQEFAASGNPGGRTPAGWYPDGVLFDLSASGTNTAVTPTAIPRIMTGVMLGTTSGSGRHDGLFRTPFPNGVSTVILIPTSGGGSPQLIPTTVTRTGFASFWPGNPNFSFTLMYVAIGW